MADAFCEGKRSTKNDYLIEVILGFHIKIHLRPTNQYTSSEPQNRARGQADTDTNADKELQTGATGMEAIGNEDRKDASVSSG